MPHTPKSWNPSSWRARPAAQQPNYPDPAALETTLGRIARLPPLVTSGEIENLKAQLAEAAEGRRFVLQGGDCAERFEDCHGQAIVNKLKILMQMSLVLTYGSRRPVIRLGRIAGQYAKPRSKDTEIIDGVELPAYRGDQVNDLLPELAVRTPDPRRLEQGYFAATATLNFIRALLEGGFANLRSPEHWQLDFIPQEGAHGAFRDIADRIRDAIDYFESLGGIGRNLRDVDFFTSHEGLLLGYEEAMTRRPRNGPRAYNLGTHFLWIGDRTRHLDGAHVEYFRGIANPIGIKVGPSMTPEELLRLLEVVDPTHEPGRVMLISRFGSEKVAQHLPPLARAVGGTGRKVVWACDPMHGNTTTTDEGFKTRDFKLIERELALAFEVHRAEGSQLSGVHFELTGENVTECIGGVEGLASADLKRAYLSGCDPRLNYAQSMEMAFLMSALLRQHKIPDLARRFSW